MSHDIKDSIAWDLLKQCRVRDDQAWKELVKRYQSSIRLLVRWRLRHEAKDSHLVEDVCQDVLLALIDKGYRRMGHYTPGRGCFKTFLGLLVDEVICQRHRRAQCRRRKREVSLKDYDPADPDGNEALRQAEYAEFLEDLSPQESRYLEEDVMGLPGQSAEPPLSAANKRFLRHRLKKKSEEHFDTP